MTEHLSAVPAPASAASGTGVGASLPLLRSTESSWDIGSSGTAVWLLAAVLLFAVLWARQRRARPPVASPGRPGAGIGAATGRQGWPWWPMGPSRAPGGLRVLQSSRLTARASVHVVEWDGRHLLVGCADQAVTLLGQRDAADAASHGAAADASGDRA